MLGHGTGPRNVKENKMNSKMKDTPHRSGQEDSKYKKEKSFITFETTEILTMTGYI